MAINAFFTPENFALAVSVGKSVSAVGIFSIIILMLFRSGGERKTGGYVYIPPPRNVARLPQKNKILKYDREEILRYFLDLSTRSLNTVAVFDRMWAAGGKFEFKLAREYKRGKNRRANEILKEQRLTMRQVEEKALKICGMLLKEPNGKLVQQIIIGGLPDSNLRFHKRLDVLIFNLPLLDCPELMEILFVPHEAYHTTEVEDGIELEEVLVHELSPKNWTHRTHNI